MLCQWNELHLAAPGAAVCPVGGSVGGWVLSRVGIQVVNGALGLPMPQKATLSFSRQLRRGQG